MRLLSTLFALAVLTTLVACGGSPAPTDSPEALESDASETAEPEDPLFSADFESGDSGEWTDSDTSDEDPSEEEDGAAPTSAEGDGESAPADTPAEAEASTDG